MSQNEFDWYYEKYGERKGPVKYDDIKSLIIINKISYGDLVWNSSLTNWVKIEETEFLEILKTVSPPPLSADKVNNVIVWFIAFAPIIGFLLEYFIAGLLWGEHKGVIKAENGDLWYVTLILNIALCYFDEHKLTTAGIDTRKFKSFAWLIPVYLYQRSELLRQSKAYFIVWIVCFILILL